MDSNRKRLSVLAAGGASALLLSACATYYQVTDPATGASYYTTEVDDEGDAGAVRFTDERTGSVVTLPSSEVREVSKDRYHDGLSGR